MHRVEADWCALAVAWHKDECSDVTGLVVYSELGSGRMEWDEQGGGGGRMGGKGSRQRGRELEDSLISFILSEPATCLILHPYVTAAVHSLLFFLL